MPRETSAEERRRRVREEMDQHVPSLWLPGPDSPVWERIEEIYVAAPPERPATPELDRYLGIIDTPGHAALEKFLRWLASVESGDLSLARWTINDTSCDEEARPIGHDEFERVLADFYGLDLDKIAAERKAMANYQRKRT